MFPGANDTVTSSFGYTFRIGVVKQNPVPGIEGKSIIQVLCSGCDKILKSAMRWQMCGRWYNNSCGNVKAQLAESGTWNCNTCRSERLQLLEKKLQNILLQTDTQEQGTGRTDTIGGSWKGSWQAVHSAGKALRQKVLSTG
jgi:hypothetical protein